MQKSTNFIKEKLLNRLHRFSYYHWPHQSSSAPIIIGGCGRSGTTLLRIILDSHSQIYCGPESELFLHTPLKNPPLVKNLSQQFNTSPNLLKRLISQSRSHAEFIDRFFSYLLTREKKHIWAEKTPRNVLRLNYIFRHFPSSRFIHIIRDGRDVSCSLITHPKYKNVNGKLVKTNVKHPIEKCVSRWLNDTGAGLKFLDHPNYHQLKYESLVTQPEKTLKELFTFLKLPFETQILSYHNVKSPSRDVTKFAASPKANQALHTSSIARWKKDLTKQQLAYFNTRASELQKQLGYQ